MIISLNNLRKGLNWRINNWAEDVDIRNTQYNDIYKDRSNGVTDNWWNVTVKRLGKWRANRPYSNSQIRKKGEKQLERIKKQYKRLISAKEPCITNLQWLDIDQLFSIAFAIKPTKSRTPVFASKMCHFLFPKLFIVMDRTATGVENYELYWRGLKDAWNAFNEKEQAQKILINAIQHRRNLPIHPEYPVETTIMEICAIGYNHSKD